jgi:hypothetical protein
VIVSLDLLAVGVSIVNARRTARAVAEAEQARQEAAEAREDVRAARRRSRANEDRLDATTDGGSRGE